MSEPLNADPTYVGVLVAVLYGMMELLKLSFKTISKLLSGKQAPHAEPLATCLLARGDLVARLRGMESAMFSTEDRTRQARIEETLYSLKKSIDDRVIPVLEMHGTRLTVIETEMKHWMISDTDKP